jgi:enediyne biosynthesis protein E4
MKISVLLAAIFFAYFDASSQSVIDSVSPIASVQDRYPTFSPDGTKILFQSTRAGGKYELYTFSVKSRQVTRLTNNDADDVTAAWSPDGKKIVYCRMIDSTYDVMVMNADGSINRNLSRHPSNDDHPKFSRDGKKIIFCSDRNRVHTATEFGNYELFMMNIDGSNLSQITSNGVWNTFPSFSPDSREIIFRRILQDSSGTRNSELFMMNADGTAIRNLTQHTAYEAYPEFSPDGKLILFSSNRNGAVRSNFQIFVMNSDGSNVRQISFNQPDESDVRAAWSPDGKSIVFNRERSGVASIMIARFPEVDESIIFHRVDTGDLATDKGCSRGIAWGDLNNDALPDAVVANCNNQNIYLYMNLGKGSFKRMTEGAVAETTGYFESVALVDYDNDNDLDVFLTTLNDQPDLLFQNDGSGNFNKVQAGGLTSDSTSAPSSCWCDYDNDGDLDAYVATRGAADDILYNNDGKGRFHRIPADNFPYAGGDGRTCAWMDIDNDGDADLYVGNFVETVNGQRVNATNFMYRNDGKGRFTRIIDGDAVTDRGRTYGTSFSDYDNDGDPDLFVTNIGLGDSSTLYVNDGKGSFSKLMPQQSGIKTGKPSKGHTWGDFNNDGFLDLFVANGTENVPDSLLNDDLYYGSAENVLKKLDARSITNDRNVSAGTAYADADNDGDLDLFVCNWKNNNEQNGWYFNHLNNTRWVRIKLKGTVSNAMGIGAKLRLTVVGNGRESVQTRWMYPQTGFASQNENVIHFSIPGDADVKALEIFWPSGRRMLVNNPAVRQTTTVVER